MISVVTLNAALFTISLFGLPLYSFQSNSKERFGQLVSFLDADEHDVVFLQEVTPYWQKRLLNKIGDEYKFSTQYATNDIAPSEALVLSRHPIQHAVFQPYQYSTGFEKFGVSKGILLTDILIHGIRYKMITTHMVASGFFKPATDEFVEEMRAREIEQLIGFVERQVNAEPDVLVLVGGDFNAGPEASAVNYEKLIEYFDDVYVTAGNIGESTEDITWSPDRDDNFWSKLIFRGAPSQRIDTFYIPKSQAGLMGENNIVTIVPTVFSDHSAVEIEFSQ